MEENIYTIAELTAQEGKLEELKSILKDLAVETRKEEGAIEYFFILDEKKANTILSYEKWTDAENEAKHWETPHLKNALGKLDAVLAEKPVIHKGKKII